MMYNLLNNFTVAFSFGIIEWIETIIVDWTLFHASVGDGTKLMSRGEN